MYVEDRAATELWLICLYGFLGKRRRLFLLLVPRLVPLTLLSRRGLQRNDLDGNEKKGGKGDRKRWSNMTDLPPEK